MKNLLSFFLIAITLSASAGGRYTLPAITGGLEITSAIVAPSVKPGDTLDIQSISSFNAFSVHDLYGTITDSIVIRWLPGSQVTTTNAGYAGVWYNVAFVKVIGLNFHNYAGPACWFRYTAHDIVLDKPRFINDYGLYADKQAIMFDDKNSTVMNYNGTKLSTFYNIEIKGAIFSGFRETNVLTMGSDGIRSVCTDFNIHDNVFKNITNYNHQAPAAIEGTCFNYHIYNNNFDSVMADKGAYQGVHQGTISIYGWGEFDHNIGGNQYANWLRLNPLKWSGLGGNYTGAKAKVLIHDNIDHHHISYSSFEISNNNSTPRIKALGLDTAATEIYHNITYSTKRDSYNGDYRGYQVDLFSHNVKVFNNIIINPEWDRPYDPQNRDNYMTAFISGRQPGFDSSHNYVFHTWKDAGIDTAKWKLLPSSPIALLKADAKLTSLTDYYGAKRPGGTANTPGAIQAEVRKLRKTFTLDSKKFSIYQDGDGNYFMEY